MKTSGKFRISIYLPEKFPEIPGGLWEVLALFDEQFMDYPWRPHQWGELGDGRGTYFLALLYNEERRPVGLALFLLSPIEKLGHLLKLAVASEYRGKGLAKDLMQESFEQLKGIGIERFYLEVAGDNIPAQRCYLSLGFNCLRKIKSYYPDGKEAWIMTIDAG